MLFVKNDMPKKRNLVNLLFAVALFVGGAVASIAAPASLSAQTAEVNVNIEDPTVAISVVSIDYQIVNSQTVARLTAKFRFADTVQVYLDGTLVQTQAVSYSDEWFELVFDVLLPDDGQHEITIQAFDGSSSTVAEVVVRAQYPEDPDNNDNSDGESSDGGSSGSVAEDGDNSWWSLRPNTGGRFAGTPQNFAIWLNLAIFLTMTLYIIHRRRNNDSKNKKS